MNVAMIPAELRERPQWVCWRLVERVGQTKPTKEPWQPDGRRRASSTDPSTWRTFEEAAAALEAGGFDGLGYVFSADDPYVGVDLDDGLIEADRAAIMVALDSYTEMSVSGAGVHVIVEASLGGHGRNRRGPFEVYEHGRYFVVTGEHVRGTPTTIEPRQAKLEEVLAHFLPAPDPNAYAPKHSVQPVDLDDRDLLDRAMRAKNGGDFRELWEGRWEGRYPSQSEADQALANKLAFWTGRDPERIDRLFRSSGLNRPKWCRATYREPTIENAIQGCTNVYSGTPSDVTRASESQVTDPKKRGSEAEAEPNGLTDSPYRESVSPESVPQRENMKSGTDSTPESHPDPERPFALPIREFIALEREQREPLLAGADGRAVVGRASLTLLGALGGQGKTTLFIDLALHLAAGVDYPPWTVPRPVSILVIENEGPEELFADKLEARLEHFPHELKARLDVCTFDWGGFSLADAELRTRLKREIADRGYDLVFGDPLDSLGIEGVGSPEDTRKFLALMKETGLHKSVAWWLNTHPRKEETKEALNEIAGAWGGKPDSVFLLRMLDGDRTQLRQPKLRWAKRGKGPALLLAFDADSEAFSYLGEESEAERDYFAEISELLVDGTRRTPKEIAASAVAGGIGANVDIVKKVLAEHPDVFGSVTGEEAKALGRKPQATLWGLLELEPEEVQP